MGIRRGDGVSYEPSGDAVVILDADATVLRTLNPVGAVIWEAFDGVRGVEELARDLVSTFEGVDEAQLADDISEFVGTLADVGLVELD